MTVIRIDNLLSLLSQITSPEGCPHTVVLVSKLSGGAVIASHSVATCHPFPPASLSDRGDEERSRLYAAVAVSSWDEEERERGIQVTELLHGKKASPSREPLNIVTELGRMTVVLIGTFLLILVGTEVSPWTVLRKKTELLKEALNEPLSKV